MVKVLPHYIVDAVMLKDKKSQQGNVTIMAQLSDGSFADVCTYFADEQHLFTADFLGYTLEDAKEIFSRVVRGSWGIAQYDAPVPCVAPMTSWSPWNGEYESGW